MRPVLDSYSVPYYYQESMASSPGRHVRSFTSSSLIFNVQSKQEYEGSEEKVSGVIWSVLH